MLKKEKTFYTIAGFILAVVLAIVLCLTLMLTGVIKLDGDKLVVCSGSQEKAYDGTPLTCDEWWVENPEKLKEGHHVQASTYGSQTEVGFSKNSLVVRVVDVNGNDVTDDYKINAKAGILFVHEEGWIDLDLSNIDIDQNLLDQLMQKEGLLEGIESFLKDKNFDLGNMGEIMDSGEYELNDFTPDQILGGLLAGGSLIDQLEEGNGTEGEEGNGGEGGDGSESEDGDGEEGEGGDGEGGSSGNGTSGMGGSFSSNLKNSGDGSDGTEQGDLLKVTSNKNGMLYMRFESFGNYNGTGWDAATPCDVQSLDVNPLNLTANTLFSSGKFPATVNVKVLTDPMYYLPQYTYYSLGNPDDIKIHEKATEYTVDSVYYDYLTDDCVLTEPPINQVVNDIYLSFVQDNYLTIDDELKTQLLDITANEFSGVTGKELIKAIASYVQNSATYNLEFSEFPADKDMIVYFLTECKEGICQHFAAAATMIYRAYGIPARYTVGCVANTIANQEITVTGENAHAWVEVYVSGLGWVTVEVTGGDNGGDEEVFEKPIIEITTLEDSKPYDGDPLYANSDEGADGGYIVVTPERLKDGHSVVCVTPDGEMPSITDIGEAPNELEFIISDGENDVSDQYELDVTYGNLFVYGIELYIMTNDAYHVYDGNPFVAVDQCGIDVAGGYRFNESNLITGHSLIVDKNSLVSITDAGRVENVMKFNVVDALGEDVSKYYNVIPVNCGYLTVYPRPITVDSNGVSSWVYDGKEHSNTEFIVPQDLVSGHTIELDKNSTVPTIKNVGNIPNNLEFIVTDGSGKDVTGNYEITCSGTLTVTKKLLTVTSQSKVLHVSNAKDGKLTHPYYKEDTVSLDELVYGHRLIVLDGPTATIDNPSIPNKLTYQIIDDAAPEGEKDVTYNYEIVETTGQLDLVDDTTKLVIQLGSATGYRSETEFVYTEDYELISGILKDGHKLVPDGDIPTLTEVGERDNEYKFKVLTTNTNEDVTTQYNIEVRKGTLKLLYKKLTLETGGETKDYDGVTLKGKEVAGNTDLTTLELAPGHVIKDINYPDITMVGSIENKVTFKIFDGKTEVTEFYEIDGKYGTLTVNPIKIKIKTPSKTITKAEFEKEPYNDVSFWCDEGWEIVEIGVNNIGISASTISYVYNGYGDRTEITLNDIGKEVKNRLKFTVTDGEGNVLKEGVDGVYEIVYEYGYLKIIDDRVTLKVKAYSAEKQDDGTPLTASVEIISALVDPNSGVVLENNLKVGHRLVIDPTSEDYCFSVNSTPGTKIANVIVKILDADGNNVIDEYNIEYVTYGTLWIYKYIATVTTESKEFSYNGTAQSHPYVENVIGIKPGYAWYIEDGSETKITNVGNTVDNRFTVHIVNEDRNPYDYKVNYVYGKLKVTPLTVMASTFVEETGTADKICYSETAEGVENWKFVVDDIVITGILAGHKVGSITSQVINGEFRFYNGGKACVSDIIIVDVKGNDVTKNYSISYNNIGKLGARPKMD